MQRTDPKAEFDRGLRRLLRRVQRRVLVHGALRLAAAGTAASLAAVWAVGGTGETGTFLGVGLSASLLALLAILLARFVVLPWRRLRTRRRLVRYIETRGDFANVLVAAEEADRLPDRWRTDDAVSRELARRLFHRAADILRILDPTTVYPVSHRVVTGTTLALGGVLVTALALLAPAEGALGVKRLLQPVNDSQPLPTGGIYADPGAGFVVAGGDIRLDALDFAGGMGTTVCEVQSGSGSWRPVPVRMEWLYPQEPGLPPPGRRWSAAVDGVREDFRWRFRRGVLVSGEQEVRVRHHPLLTRLEARITPPAYTGLPAQDLARLPSWIEVPTGSELHLEGTATQPIAAGRIVTSGPDTVSLRPDAAVVQAAWEIAGPQTFRVEIRNEYGLENESPVRYEVAVSADQEPVVHLERPDDDGTLPIEADLALMVEAVDDFGLTRLRLLVRTVSDAGTPQAAGIGGAPDSLAAEGWEGGAFWTPATHGDAAWIELETTNGTVRVRPAAVTDPEPGMALRMGLAVQAGGLELVAGDALELLVEGVDNRRPGPPGRGRSNVLRLVLPSASDVLAQQAQTAETQRSDLEEMRRRSRELSADLDRLNRELLKNPVPDWSRQQEMQATLQRQQALQQELSRVAQGIRQELDRLAESQLTSGEMLDKADEVVSLLDQDFGDQLRELLDKLSDPRSRASAEEVARAIQELDHDQKEMARRLDAALAMMDRMAREQELEGLTTMLEKLMRKQQALAEESRRRAEQDAGDRQDETAESEAKDPGERSGEQQGESQRKDPAGEQGENPSAEEQEQSRRQDGKDPAGEASPEELARRQEALAKELEELREKLESALENLAEQNESGEPSEADQQYADALDEAMDQLQEQLEKQNMKKAAEKMASMDPQKAAQMQQEAMRDLGALYHVLMKTQQAMEMAMQNQQVSSLRGLAADLLAVSERQEAISFRIPVQLREARTRDLTRGQHRLQKSTAGIRDRLAELLDESPQQIMALLRKMDTLIEEMGRSLAAMNENRSLMARQYAASSLGEANSLVIHLLTQAQMAGGGGGGGGAKPMPSAGEQLQQLAREQAGLNGSLEEIRRLLANRGISQELRAQMQRLGEQQGGLAGELEELARREDENPEGERILGDLHELGRRMEQVSREIEDGLVSEETLVRQDRILGRLLDARNSVRRRDYSQRRESQAALHRFEEQEGYDGWADEDSDKPQRLRFQPLSKAPLEYRDLVRRYFSALDSLRRAEGGAEEIQ